MNGDEDFTKYVLEYVPKDSAVKAIRYIRHAYNAVQLQWMISNQTLVDGNTVIRTALDGRILVRDERVWHELLDGEWIVIHERTVKTMFDDRLNELYTELR